MCVLAACSSAPKPPDVAAQEASAAARIQSIPDPQPEKYGKLRDYKEWRNPYLIIQAKGVSVFDVSNNEQHLIRAEDLTRELALLPASAWPYGRVVAVTESASKPGSDEAANVRKNRGIVLGTLESLHVLVSAAPSKG